MAVVKQLDPTQRDLVGKLRELLEEAEAGRLNGLYGVAVYANGSGDDPADLLPVVEGVFGDGPELVLRLKNMRQLVERSIMDDDDCPWAALLGHDDDEDEPDQT